MYKNIPAVARTVYGPGSFNQLGDILAPKRQRPEDFMVFIVDNYFKGKELETRLPVQGRDMTFFVDVTPHEPTTEQIDHLRDAILQAQGLPAGVIGIGGGSIMDIAKAVALMLTNEGSSEQYQGLNLIKNPGVYHVGVPTISGTGAEVSMTAVLTGPKKKLGIKCEWTVFDQIVLDPTLTATVPRDQWFYTGMDTFIHCIESITGHMQNTYSQAYGYKALDLCREVYLGPNSGQNPEMNEKLMVASLFGGLSLTYSEVGICHALSYGLSYVLGMRHGYANCIAFNHLEDFYPEGVREFKAMAAKHHIYLPQNLSRNWTDEQIEKMTEISLGLHHMWSHALGPHWQEKITPQQVQELFERM
ncbi:MAG: iron-containing alcohol dehydrogenase family protein [Cytophagales bacterium]|nr:iron-containing alcohol dehydrogenase family protein [Bernardetiaceae bacterium]MDW8210872.1 iron-containing alcohol dehydrogenase family protein [Cytophagales bacterium]